MENMIKVRAMRAAGIACFFSARDLLAHGFFTTPSGDIVSALFSCRKNGWRWCNLRYLLCSQPVHLLQDLLPIISGNGD